MLSVTHDLPVLAPANRAVCLARAINGLAIQSSAWWSCVQKVRQSMSMPSISSGLGAVGVVGVGLVCR